MKVLIFDDELFHAQSQYRMPGLELVFFENADDVESAVLRERPAAVLMDYSMRGRLSGADAVAALRKKALFGPLKIIGISTDVAANQRMIDVGADDALPKTHVRAYLHKLIEGDRLSRREEHL